MLNCLKESYGELEQETCRMSFDKHPFWTCLYDEIEKLSSIAIVDNTMVQNALNLMECGLGDDDTFNAALLPDLAVFLFTITHFDDLLLLDHGLSTTQRDKVDSLLGNMVFRKVLWEEESSKDEMLRDELYKKFNSIQHSFSKRDNLHDEWSAAWAELLNAKSISIQYFVDGSPIEMLIDSPAHPLLTDLSDFSTDFLKAVSKDSNWIPKPLWKPSLQASKYSIMASYHTFRSIFYHCVSDFLRVPYLACGTRGISVNYLPVQNLTDSDCLNPNFPYTFEKLAQIGELQKVGMNISLPALKATPTLALALNKAKEYKDPKWSNIIDEIRYESADYRKTVALFMKACREETFDFQTIRNFIDSFDSGTHDILKAAGSFLSLSGKLMGSFITENPTLTVSALRDVIKDRPWDFVSKRMRRFHLRFILRAADLATNTFLVEQECHKIWGRRFSKGEREYLKRLQKLSPSLSC